MCQEFGLEPGNSAIPQIASGFAGGIGNTGAVCGAVVGGVMAIGLKLGRAATVEEMLQNLGVAREFRRRFEAEMGEIGCRELTGLDLTTDEGVAQLMNSGRRSAGVLPSGRDSLPTGGGAAEGDRVGRFPTRAVGLAAQLTHAPDERGCPGVCIRTRRATPTSGPTGATNSRRTQVDVAGEAIVYCIEFDDAENQCGIGGGNVGCRGELARCARFTVHLHNGMCVLTSGNEVVEAAFFIGEGYHRRGMLDQALRWYQEALRHQPGNEFLAGRIAELRGAN